MEKTILAIDDLVSKTKDHKKRTQKKMNETPPKIKDDEEINKPPVQTTGAQLAL